MGKHTDARRAAVVQCMAELAELTAEHGAALRVFRAAYTRKTTALAAACARLDVAEPAKSHDYSFPDADELTEPDELAAEASSWRFEAGRV